MRQRQYLSKIEPIYTFYSSNSSECHLCKVNLHIIIIYSDILFNEIFKILFNYLFSFILIRNYDVTLTGTVYRPNMFVKD